MAIQDHHGHHYSSPIAEEDVDDVVDDREVEEGKDFTFFLSDNQFQSSPFGMHSLNAQAKCASESRYGSSFLLSGRSRCILFQQLKWMC